MNKELFIFCLRLADNCLILAHRQSELCSKSPFLEEDIAQTNFGLDLLGQAEAIYNFAVEIEGNINTPDVLYTKEMKGVFTILFYLNNLIPILHLLLLDSISCLFILK